MRLYNLQGSGVSFFYIPKAEIMSRFAQAHKQQSREDKMKLIELRLAIQRQWKAAKFQAETKIDPSRKNDWLQTKSDELKGIYRPKLVELGHTNGAGFWTSLID